ncbi:MAG: carbohydrate kinase family protein [Thermotogaceae bacterium]|nr:carbohydrate kinase family protein [Thermotogaceae bacterium]
MAKVAILGSVGLDIVLGPVNKPPMWGHEVVVSEMSMRFTGAAGNTAAVLRALGDDVDILSVVGNDYLGKLFIEVYKKMGIEKDIKTVKGNTSVSIGIKRPDGERFFITHLGVVEKADYSEIFKNYDFNQKIILVCGVNLIPCMWRETFSEFLGEVRKVAKVLIDPGCPENWEAFRPVISRLIENADLFLPNSNEFLKLTGKYNLSEAFEEYSARFETPAVVKLGEQGAIYLDRKEKINSNGKRVKRIIDTVGAGDAFNAGIIHSLLKKGKIGPKELDFANKVAAEWISGGFRSSVDA